MEISEYHFFWEEKIILFIRYLQLYSLVYIAFYEYWPYDYVTYLGNYLVSLGFNFIYLQKGFYTFIQDFNTYGYNIAGWIGVCMILVACGVTIIRVKKFRHEFKHSKTLLKKWLFNIVEILYIPILFNLIPMLICEYSTIKNGYSLHKCSSYGSKYYFYIIAIALIIVGILYNIGLVYMISKRKISYRQKDHDGFIKRKELEYILEISDSWRKQSFFIFSSFKGSKLRVYFKPLFNMYLLFLICVHAFTEANSGTKASIYSVTFTIAFIFIIAVRPFRCASSNFLITVMFFHLCFPTFMVAEYISGLQNGLLTNYYFSLCLYMMFSVSIGVQAIIVLACLIFKAKWPMNVKRLREAVYRHERILEMMQKAFTIITKLRLKKVDTRVKDLEEMVEDLTDEYNMAFSEEHPFQYTVLELIDELKDTAVIIDDRKRKQEYHFLADFLEIIDDKKSYL